MMEESITLDLAFRGLGEEDEEKNGDSPLEEDSEEEGEDTEEESFGDDEEPEEF